MVLSKFESLAVLPLVLAIHHVCAVPIGAGNSSAAPPPTGGLTEDPPAYVPLSDFDFQSLNLGLNQEYMELDLFNFALQRFNSDEFAAAGLGPNDEELIAFMASQEVGHATALTNILGEDRAAKPCNFSWPVNTVSEFIDLSQRITRFGESGVFGFLNKLNSRSSAQILTQSISTESRQQLIFRQWEGLFPMPVWFETGITQSMQWTLMAPYFTSCPASNPEIKWNNYPALNITNSSSSSSNNITSHQFSDPAIAPNVSAGLSSPGQTVHFSFEAPGKAIGPNGCFVTVTNTTGSPRFAAWISQLNVTYTELAEVSVGGGNGNGTGTASTIQPGGTVFQGKDDPIVNGTMFIVLTDSNPFVTPFNVSELDAHVVAGPAIYQSG